MRIEAILFLAAAGLFGAIIAFGGPGTQRFDVWPEPDAATAALAHGPAADGSMRFGLDAPSVQRAAEHGVHPDYGTIWVGPWTLQWGWHEAERALQGLAAANVTPAVHLYYWGDDIHRDCFAVGCNGKTMQGWDELAIGLAQRLQRRAGPGPATHVHGIAHHHRRSLDRASGRPLGRVRGPAAVRRGPDAVAQIIAP